MFQTPSHNIGCNLSVGGVFCAIVKADWAPADEPDCPADAGRYVTLDRTIAVNCGMQDSPTGQVLPYGDKLVADEFTCTSAEDGLTCSGPPGSFFLSRERIEVR